MVTCFWDNTPMPESLKRAIFSFPTSCLCGFFNELFSHNSV
jgi:hypothetical protein